MLQVGNTLPDFETINQDGKIINSKDFIGKKWIFFFYPKADTPGCTAEACDISNHIEELLVAGYHVIGVSADDQKKQKKFHEKYKLKYDLIADETKEVVTKFGVWQEKKFMGKTYMGILRTTFIFDENGICTSIIDKVKTKEAAAQILAS